MGKLRDAEGAGQQVAKVPDITDTAEGAEADEAEADTATVIDLTDSASPPRRFYANPADR